MNELIHQSEALQGLEDIMKQFGNMIIQRDNKIAELEAQIEQLMSLIEESQK